MDLVKRIIIHLIAEVRDRGGSLTKTKLMKLLYLIDVEAYRDSHRTITAAHWFFFLFGPYASEINDALNALAGYHVEETEFLSRYGKRGITYRTDEDARLHEVLSLDQRLIVESVLQRWAQEELNPILDFVYFNTPPMAGARFGVELDFTSILRARADDSVAISPIAANVIERLRTKYHSTKAQRRTAQSQIAITPPRCDDLFWQSLQNMSEEEVQEVGALSGSSVLLTTEAKDSLGEQS